MDIKDVQNSNFKRLKHERPKDAKANSVMNLEVEVDATPQKLGRKLRDFSSYCLNIPAMMSPESQIFMQLLMSVFEKKGEVREGLLKDIVFGFSAAGIPPALSMKGAIDCFKQGYLEFRTPGNFVITRNNEIPTNLIDCFVIYTDKLLDMTYERGAPSNEQQKIANSILKENFKKEIPGEDSSS
jgi:hypothetical protein